MSSKSPRRSHRSKGGVKTTHVLQICVLVAVCFWLIYQVKHSPEKKEFVEKDGRLVDEMQTRTEMIKLGRKDVPRVTNTTVDTRSHGEDEEDDEEEEESKPGKSVQERQQIKVSKGSDDGIAKPKSKKTDGEAEHEGELHKMQNDEEEGEDQSEDSKEGGTEKESGNIEPEELHKRQDEEEEGEEQTEDSKEIGNEEEPREVEPEEFHNERQGEGEGVDKSEDGEEGDNQEDHRDHRSEYHDNDEGDEGTHEARERQYKGDDASSEVAHEVVKLTSEHPNDKSQMEQVARNYDQAIFKEKSAFLQDREEEVPESSANSTYTDQLKDKGPQSKLEDSSAKDSTSNESQNPVALPGAIEVTHNLTEVQNAIVKAKPFEESFNSHIKRPMQANNPQLAIDARQSESMTVSSNTKQANDAASEPLSFSEEVKLDVPKIKGNEDDSAEESKVNNKDSENVRTDESKVTDEENGENNGDLELFDSRLKNVNVHSDMHDEPTVGSDSSIMLEKNDSQMDLLQTVTEETLRHGD